MDYNRILGPKINEPMNISGPLVIDRRTARSLSAEIYRPRLGIPTGFISWEENKLDIDKILSRFRNKGYTAGIPKNIDEDLQRHVEYFRNCLDIYDHMFEDTVFCRDELYYRCLAEGPAFTTYVKKCRAFSLQDKIALDANKIPDEYVLERYSGYDSIFHERYLIYWDDSNDTVDWPYSLIDTKPINEEKFQEAVDELLQGIGCTDYCEPDYISLYEPIAKKVTSLANKGKTVLLKDAWKPMTSSLSQEWWATRRVVPTYPGSTRDTGVPDVETLCKVKLIHQHARFLSERCKHSANCSYPVMNTRINRMKKCNRFIHIDFKKFGLTANRQTANILLRRLGKSNLQINDFYLETEDEIYKTSRGSVLGWLDPLIALCIIAILLKLKKDNNWTDMDFIGFNDDFEIGFSHTTNVEKLEDRKRIILDELEEFDYILSYRKIYISKESIFLEQYNKFENNKLGLTMSKMQLTVGYFAKSLSTPYSWEAKLYHALGHRYVRSKWISSICKETIKQLFPDEYDKPVELGGWEYSLENNISTCLEKAEHEDIVFFLKMLRYKEPHLMPKMVDVSIDAIFEQKHYRTQVESTKLLPEHLHSSIKLEVRSTLTNIAADVGELIARSPEEEHTGFSSSEEDDFDYSHHGDWG